MALNLKNILIRDAKDLKDNPVDERFNKTLEDEFIELGNFTIDVANFNQNLTE